jgi:hypothetical protein
LHLIAIDGSAVDTVIPAHWSSRSGRSAQNSARASSTAALSSSGGYRRVSAADNSFRWLGDR